MGGVIYVEIMSFFLHFFLQLVLELHPQRDVFGEANGFTDDRYFEFRLMALHDAWITSFLRSLKKTLYICQQERWNNVIEV